MTVEQFLKDIAGHKMTAKLDSDTYRHLVFRAAKDSWNMWFEIVTPPGCLALHGDMGTWTFSRVEDMFTFFRDGEKLSINPHYWCEKLQAGTGSEGMDLAKDFDADEFKKRVMEQLGDCFDIASDTLAEATAALTEEWQCMDDNEHELRQAVYEFKFGDFRFDSCEIPDGKVWSYHYLWCLYAIVWGIQQYDAHAAARFAERISQERCEFAEVAA